jgi:drug/metabolite transporter (DMT)-like permease
MKKGLEVYSSEQVASLRIGLAAILFFPIFLRYVPKIKRKQLPYVLLVTLTGSGIPAFLFAFAQTEISSSLAGILNSLTPLFTFVFGLLFFGQSFQWRSLSGVFLGLSGAILLVVLSNNSSINGNIYYALLAVLAAMCYGISGNTVNTYLRSMTAFGLNATTFSLLGPFVIAYLLQTDFLNTLQYQEGAWKALGYIAILSWVGTFAATVLFFQLVQWNDAVFGSSVAYLIPIVALIWGALDGEQLEIFHLIGLALIISGVYAIRKGKSTSSKKSDA